MWYIDTTLVARTARHLYAGHDDRRVIYDSTDKNGCDEP